MKLGVAGGALALLAGCSSFPGASTKEADDHAAHHPPQATAKVDDAKFDQQMKMMHDMHRKMVTAKTPEERAALIKDHMKAMQDGMAMMGQMRGGMRMGMGGKGPMGDGMPMDPGAMQHRMDMMEMMMQMMMDREGMKSPASK